jgi:hypothetical protein
MLVCMGDEKGMFDFCCWAAMWSANDLPEAGGTLLLGAAMG